MKSNRPQIIILSVVVVVCTIFVCWSSKQDAHIHGWGKWQDAGRSGYNDWGTPHIEQHRYCTNCGYIQAEIH